MEGKISMVIVGCGDVAKKRHAPHVLAGLQALHADLPVGALRGGHQNSVHILVCQDLLQAVVDLAAEVEEVFLSANTLAKTMSDGSPIPYEDQAVILPPSSKFWFPATCRPR